MTAPPFTATILPATDCIALDLHDGYGPQYFWPRGFVTEDGVEVETLRELVERLKKERAEQL